MTQRLPRRVAHLDMDAFYASVALLHYPQLAGLPMVIGGPRHGPEALLAILKQGGADQALTVGQLAQVPPHCFPRLRHYRGRGVITTATYAARRLGLHSAMGLTRAARLCPDAILLPPDFEEYRRVSRQFKAIILGMAPVMEDRGIDEVYIDFTTVPGGQDEGGRLLALQLQQAIAQATGLSCSIGVAPNKLLAKMASEFDKPNGISILHAGELESRIWPLPCHRINGIGPKTRQKLLEHNIESIGDLARCPLAWLIGRFGSRQGNWLHQAARGIDERAVQTRSEPVSISRESTFERDLHPLHDRIELRQIFSSLVEKTASELQRKGYAGRTIGIKVRYADFRVATRDQTLPVATQDARQIWRAAGLCLRRLELAQHLRLIGIRISALQKVASATPAQADADKLWPSGATSLAPDSTRSPATVARQLSLNF